MPTDLRRPQRTYSIRQLCLEFKCTPRALRFYEDKGLLAPARDGMNRVYSYKDRARLQLILRGKRLGLSLEESREIIGMYDPDHGNEQQLQRLVERIREQRAALQARLADLQAMMAELDAVEAGCLASLRRARAVQGSTRLPRKRAQR